MTPRARRPFLHDLVTSVRAPAFALSPTDGQIRAGGAAGVFVDDRRTVSASVLTLDGVEPVPLRWEGHTRGARFVAVAANLGDDTAAPTVLVERVRTLSADGVQETVIVTSHASAPLTVMVELHVEADLAEVADVKSGLIAPPLPVEPGLADLSWRAGDGSHVHLQMHPAPDSVSPEGSVCWRVVVDRRSTVTLSLSWSTGGGLPAAVVSPPTAHPVFAAPRIRADDHRLAELLTQSLDDLAGLLVADPFDTRDLFLAAGAPWFLTLFGRDSLWAARMLLPLGTELAGGTLRTLARRQGRRVDPGTGEEPGKIPHELRRTAVGHRPAHGGDRPLVLPPLYYGTVDATALWISLLHDAWRWGMPEAEIVPLLPALQAALSWLSDSGTDGAGFLRYRDSYGHGLANQGWKDSIDAIQFHSGELAVGPVALCEVQAYAYAAARQGASLLDGFGLPDGDRWRAWADGLRQRFRSSFWVADADGPFPAVALDGTGRPVDSVTSNIGHLLATDLLDNAETDLVVARLASPELDSGVGLRTLSDRAAGYNPSGYHTGSVWAHDTAIAVTGLSAVGTPSAHGAATGLIQGLLRAATDFENRLPELYCGHSPRPAEHVLPYPAACRPQAWSAAASVAILTAALRVRPDVPGGTLAFAPPSPSPVGAIDVRGLRLAGQPVSMTLSALGEIEKLELPAGVRRSPAGTVRIQRRPDQEETPTESAPRPR